MTAPGRVCPCGMPMILRRGLAWVCRHCDLLGLFAFGPIDNQQLPRGMRRDG